jgi:hypothetical protein
MFSQYTSGEGKKKKEKSVVHWLNKLPRRLNILAKYTV